MKPLELKEQTLQTLLHEKRAFFPSKEFQSKARVTDTSLFDKASKNMEQFWAQRALDLEWFKKWETVLEWKPPFAKWFIGGKLNASYNCLDRHVKNGLGKKTAFIWQGEGGAERIISYEEAFKEVQKFANVLKKLGVVKGDRVAIYLPMIPEACFAMLACARIGAVHSVVF
ncbi:MAG: acetyl-coenzyme A synthetase, partial [Candidatus Omnitrophica bacterium CG12_big_fil_rev_8_21_14_0_65_50_5]